jgi:hypothetical protein
MKTNWIATVATGAIALSLAAGSGAYAQMADSHRHESGPGGQGSSMSRPGARPEAGRSAAGEQRALGERSEHQAQPAMREHAETSRPHEMGADRAQAEDRHQPREATQTIGQGADRAARSERALPNGAAENRANESRAGHEAQQRSEPNREQGKTADIKQNKPAETSKSAASGRHGQDVGQGRIGRNDRQPEKLTGQNQHQHGTETEHAAQGQQQNKEVEQHSQPGSATTQQQAARPTPGQTTGEARQHEGTGQAQNRDNSSREQAQGRAGEMQGASNARGQMASTKVNNSQRTQVLDRLRSDRDLERARSDVNIRVDVGERLPERVRPLPLPPDIVDVVPEYRGYEYTVIHDEVAIINPESREVVDVIPERGFTAESGSYGGAYAEGGRIELSHEQREVLRRAALSSATTVGSSGPSCLSLRPVPEELARSRPELASDKYLAIGDQIVLVDPHDQKIVQVINSND